MRIKSEQMQKRKEKKRTIDIRNGLNGIKSVEQNKQNPGINANNAHL